MSDRKIAEIRERADIAEVISRYVPLKLIGRNYLGLCPFHAENTPSFSVSRERGGFHCFGCGLSGDIFRFLMLLKNISALKAIRKVAKEYGIRTKPPTRRSKG